MNTIKMWLFIAGIALVSIMGTIIQNQHYKLDHLEKELMETKQLLKLEEKEGQMRLAAFEEREKELINDRKEIENEYNELTKTKQSCEIYTAWGNVHLPDNVSILLRN